MKRYLSVPAVLTVFGALPALPAAAAAHHTWVVKPGQSIQAAVNRAASGDTIDIKAGTYHEAVCVDGKGLTVKGAGRGNTTIAYPAWQTAGSDVVGRAVKVAFTDEMDFEDQRQQFLHEMQMLLTYKDGPLAGQVLDWDLDLGPGPGDRAPDVRGLTRRGIGHGFGLFYVDGSTRASELADLERLSSSLAARLGPAVLRPLIVAAPDAKVDSAALPVYVDADGTYRATFSPSGPSVYLIRPDGHVGFRSVPVF